MLPLSIINRCVAVFILTMGLIAVGCNRKTDAQPAQKAHATIDPKENDYDEDGYPIDRNRQPGVGTTHLRGDGLEELHIPLREDVGPFGPLRERFFEDDPVMPREVKPQDRRR